MTDLEEVPPDGTPPPPPPTSLIETLRHYHISAPMPGTLVVHTEFHRLIGNVEDAAIMFGHQMCGAGSSRTILDAYEVLQQQKKEVYMWVVANARPPEEAYRLKLRF